MSDTCINSNWTDKSAFAVNHATNSKYEDRGFFIRFKNGYEISVQFGSYNGCDQGKTTAEVAVFDPEGDFCHLNGRSPDPLFRVTPEQLAELIFDYSMKKFDKSEKVEEDIL
jgi:hypothetical protein